MYHLRLVLYLFVRYSVLSLLLLILGLHSLVNVLISQLPAFVPGKLSPPLSSLSWLARGIAIFGRICASGHANSDECHCQRGVSDVHVCLRLDAISKFCQLAGLADQVLVPLNISVLPALLHV